MHQRTLLSILTLPIVTAFTYPVVFRPTQDALRIEMWNANRDSNVGFSDIQEVLALIGSDYVDEPDMDKVIDGGMQSVLEHAHPMNSYLTVGDLQLSDPGLADIGITVIKRQIYALVISVVPGSPAARSGFKVGDIIRKLDNNSVSIMNTWTLERKLRGRVGSDLSVLRYIANTGKLEKLTLKREIIKVPPITFISDSRVNIVTLTDLNQGRSLELRSILEGLNHNVPLILDIRNCAGGSLFEAASVAGMFVSDGPLVTIQEVGKPSVQLSVIPASILKFARVALLQGRYTVGVSEVLSSALKRQLVPVFGDSTYGLGVERTRFLLRHGGAAEIVNKRWIGAGGELLGTSGKRPDDQKAMEVLKDDIGVTISSPGNCGVLPNYAIKVSSSVDDWLPRVLEIIKTKCN